MIEDVVVMLLRAAASKYADSVRQMWLFGGCAGQRCTTERVCIHRAFSTASIVRYPRRLRSRHNLEHE